MPFKGLIAVEPFNVFRIAMDNSFSEAPSSWNLGLPAAFLLIGISAKFLTSEHSNRQWKKWFYLTLLSLFVTFNWLPLEFLSQTEFGVIQFLGRFLGGSALFLTVTLIVFMKEEHIKKNIALFIITFILSMSISSMYNYNFRPSLLPGGTQHVTLSKWNYSKILNESVLSDYQPMNDKKESVLHQTAGTKIRLLNVTENSSSWMVQRVHSRISALPIALYKGIPYKIYINGKRVRSRAAKFVSLSLKTGDTVRVASSVPLFNYVTFTITLLSTSIFLFFACVQYFQIRKKKTKI